MERLSTMACPLVLVLRLPPAGRVLEPVEGSEKDTLNSALALRLLSKYKEAAIRNAGPASPPLKRPHHESSVGDPSPGSPGTTPSWDVPNGGEVKPVDEAHEARSSEEGGRTGVAGGLAVGRGRLDVSGRRGMRGRGRGRGARALKGLGANHPLASAPAKGGPLVRPSAGRLRRSRQH
ncbi:unnamed protein product [Ostreobium quekettii]|uniref:Uncharacterized protein n=1 Tax=Ostreobium quekettii TaxID=121088 RepID=A0A8S1IX22_9CHLO|nr:unnamed protein product [Ostreobium quekettii]